METTPVLTALCPEAGTPAQAAALAAQLGDEPLGARLAAAYLARVRGTFTGYRTVLLLPPAPQLDTAIELALERLDDEGLGQARTLLRLLAVLPGAPVPYPELLDLELLADSELFPRLTGPHLAALLDGLAGLALVEMATAGTLTMDPAVREFADRDGRDSGQRPAHVAQLGDLIVAAPPRVVAAVAAHFLGLVVEDRVDDEDTAEVDRIANTCLHVGDALAEDERFGEARAVGTAVVAVARRVLGPAHRRTLLALTFLAGWTGHDGDPAGAHALLTEVTATYRPVADPIDPDALVAFANRAYWAARAGDAVAARDAYSELVPLRTRQAGPDDRDVLFDRGELAHWTGMAGDAAAAHAQFSALLPEFERTWGADAEDVVAMREAITRWET
ncbi:hypothetical protein [Pseudosporangium ferrugineum]|uniref:hypothetical protein n=1 Tax=Pseudosporangium ferrugineum TaxID=439699 RepID=UPI0011B27804|nr:hypothetical protein [Pseudosporangium ferrugineum]